MDCAAGWSVWFFQPRARERWQGDAAILSQTLSQAGRTAPLESILAEQAASRAAHLSIGSLHALKPFARLAVALELMKGNRRHPVQRQAVDDLAGGGNVQPRAAMADLNVPEFGMLFRAEQAVCNTSLEFYRDLPPARLAQEFQNLLGDRRQGVPSRMDVAVFQRGQRHTQLDRATQTVLFDVVEHILKRRLPIRKVERNAGGPAQHCQMTLEQLELLVTVGIRSIAVYNPPGPELHRPA